MTPSVRKATPGDIEFISENLRVADRQEVLAASGRHPSDSLRDGLDAGPAFVWVCEGEPAVLFGAAPLSTVSASIWMVGTPALEVHQRYLIRQARVWVDAFNADWPLLVNSADARNILHHRFIRWCGFTFFAERRLNGLRFLDFARIREPPCVNQPRSL